jgi:phage gp29-like protein
MNMKTTVDREWARRGKRMRSNPLLNLQQATLERHLDAFEAGHLREAANIWEHLEQRDDLLRSVVSKRKKSAGRQGWIVTKRAGLRPEQEAEARQHAQALEFFYENLECEHALDTNEKGGFKLLARQMMDAVGKRFAVHEIVWRVNEREDGWTMLTAKFRFVPLTFFENTTGALRFLEKDSALAGTALEPGAWMVTVGEGLMVASSRAWIVKHMTLADWSSFSTRNGFPVLSGSTAAAKGTAEYQELENALQDLIEKRSAIHSTTGEIKVLDMDGGSSIPFPQLVERMDRMMAVLWRGADLSTISRDRGYGASLQEKETCALEEDDAEMLSETLNRYVDEWVIRYLFGEDVKPLAQVKVLVTPRECTSTDLQVDEFLLRHGARLPLVQTLERYGRKLPEADEAVLAAREEGNNEVRAHGRAA